MIARTARTFARYFSGEAAHMAEHAAFGAVVGEHDRTVFAHHAFAHLGQTMKLEKPRQLRSSMVRSPAPRRMAISFIKAREKGGLALGL